MGRNVSYYLAKFLKYIRRPALRDCSIDKTAHIGPGSNCIRVSMGRYSYMGDDNSVVNTQIGKFCSIASGCSIGGGAHPVAAVSTSPVFYRGRNVLHTNFASLEEPLTEKVVIGNDVWIGEMAFIKDGVSIGDGAIIGAHAVVTRDVPAYAIVVGVPAKIIRFRFNEATIVKLLACKWWEWPESKIKEMGCHFGNPEEFCLNCIERV